MTGSPTLGVIGGGLAGMTAAAMGARAGLRVTVFEQGSHPGGRAITTSRNGLLLNIGPHALYRHGAAHRILNGLGVRWSGARPRLTGYAVIGQRRRRLPIGLSSFALSGALSGRGKLELARALTNLARCDTHELQSVPLRRWLDETFADSTARRAFQAFTRVASYANGPEITSAGATLDQLRIGAGSVVYLDGGWQTLVDGLFTVATAAGVELRTRARVGAVRPAGDRWAVESSGGRDEFDAVILAVPPGAAARLTGAGEESPLATWAREAIPVRAAVLDVAVDELPNRHGLYALGFDRPTYLSVHSAWARLAPEGQWLITTAWYRAPDERTSDAEIEGELERLLDIVQPGWRSHVVFRRFLPDPIVANDHVRAATAGFEARPGPAVPGLPGLFVAGDWVGPEGMIGDAAVASGAAAAEFAAAHVGRAPGAARVLAAAG